MPRPYSVIFAPTTVANASGDVDLFELSPADDKPVEIVGLELYVTSELGDAADEWAAIQVIRGFTASGSGGSTPTPAPMDPIDTAAGFAAEVLNTTVATTGTSVTLWSGAVNVRAGLEHWWPQGFGPQASQANTTILVRMSTTVADDVTMAGTLYVMEK